MFLIRRFVQAVGLRIVAMAAGLGISVLLARVLGAEEFGHYVFAFSMVTLVAVPVQAGLPMLLIKSLPKYQEAEDPDRIYGLLLFTLLFVLAFSGLAFIVYWGLDFWLANQFGPYAGQETMDLAILLVPFIALSTSLGAAIRALGRLVTGQFIETAMRQVVLLAMLSVAALGIVGMQLSAMTAMCMHIAAATVTMLLGVAVVLLWCGLGMTHGLNSARIEWRRWAVNLLPLSIIAGMQIVLNKTDVIMLRGLVGAEEVAIYFVANQVGNLVFLTNQAVQMVNGPMLARAVQQGDLAAVQDVYSRGALFVFLSTLPSVVLLFLFGKPIIELIFGSEYLVTYPIVIAFAFGYMLQAIFGHTDILLKVTNNEWVVLRTVGLALVANLALNAALIPVLGALGAALASITVTLAVKLHLSLQIRHRVGISAFAFASRSANPNTFE